MTAPTAIPQRPCFAPHPSKAGRTQVKCRNAAAVVSFLDLWSTFFRFADIYLGYAGLILENPTFFNSSPFKVLSPQPPKFLKCLLPVKEENKVKKVLEARPLLGLEVTNQIHLFSRGEYSRFLLCCFCKTILLKTFFTPFHIISSYISLHFAMNSLTLITITNCPKLPGALIVKMADDHIY